MDADHTRCQSREELQRRIAEGWAPKYLFFWGHTGRPGIVGKECLSQWHVSPFEVEGLVYPTAEHWMMAQKALLFGDPASAEAICRVSHPGEAKKLGRAVPGFDQELWESRRFEIVVTGNVHKFSQHPELREFLLGTGSRVLVEASPRDCIWGIGLSADNERALHPDTWRGLNLLGFALLEARSRIAQSTSSTPAA
jgi:ribA/ribD-fused uncharacterized protein